MDARLQAATPSHSAAPAAGSVAVVTRRLDTLPITRLHVAALAVCTLGLFTDIAEVALSNALAAIFLAPPHNMPRGSLSLLLASVFAGGAVGAPFFGILGDRFGRRRALQASLALMAAGSLAAAASQGLTALTLARTVSGFAIGGFPPLVATYLAEVTPARHRGATLMVCAGIGLLGGLAVLLLVQALAPGAPLGVEPWRWALILGGALAALGSILFAGLPESPRWLASVGRPVEADGACRRFERAAGRAPVVGAADLAPAPAIHGPAIHGPAGFRALFTGTRQTRQTALFVGLFTLAPLATIAFPLLSAVVMVEKGFRVDQSLAFAALSMLGPPLGTLLTALVIDRLERRACLTALAAAMAALGTAFAASGTFLTLVLVGIAFNTAAATYGSVLAVYATELLPTPLRASAMTCAWAGGRVAAALAPLILLPVLSAYGPHAMFAVITIVLGASAALLLAGPRGLSGRAVA
ncbi:putative MFS transporter [Methylobacterium fujisawaense]|uniref:MFS transporter n=1 Tax=Methylobacterium fujisawaense TaxID=107400 RepID=A0ABR6D589_9HYPH|nr:MFS transporter [Methylobacterium fujisawaense]MBA9061256.1 putative MFS transporter [Methylobacterium fujisawaense]